ncbi:hypothetical protein RRF57_006583 [Xylaria bambusicola]|uniref:Ricin B lectin domain-containing protein n=1 Tax=Xylaria bambusicola TaxID=326684 RepID=A0AAN7UJJ4_9PEZI
MGGSYIIQSSNFFILSITPTRQIMSSGMNYNALDSQLFNFTPQSQQDTFTITHISTGSVLEVPGGNVTPGTQLILANPNGMDSQLWIVAKVISFSDYYTIQNVASKTVIWMNFPFIFMNSSTGDPREMWKLLDIPGSNTPNPIVQPPGGTGNTGGPNPIIFPGGGGGVRPALPGLGRPGDVALVKLFPTGNICGNPQCCRTFICAVDYNRNVQPLGYRGV